MKIYTTLISLGLVAGGSLPASAAAFTQGAERVPQGYISTATRAFPLASVRGTDMGAAPDGAPLKVVVALTPRNENMIDRILAKQNTKGDPMYHAYLKPAQTRAMFSPTAASVRAAAAYMTSKGYKNLVVSPDNMIITAYGTVANANAAFSSNEHVAMVHGKRVMANARAAVIPRELQGSVRAVLGLSTVEAHTFINTSHVHSNLVYTNPLRPALSGCTVVNPATGSCTGLVIFGPRDFWYAYDTAGYAIQGQGFTADFRSGINTPIAIFAEGDLSQVALDLRQYENRFQLPQTSYNFIYPSIPSTDTSGVDEWDLDTQTSSGVAGNVKALDVYAADSLTDADTLISYEAFKNADVEKAASASYGECDTLAMTNGSITVTDSVFGQAALQGQTIFASSGDNGAFCLGAMNGVNGGVPGTLYPASSKYVVGVGGTSLFVTANGTYNGEKSWENGGGGISAVENAGFWQTPVLNAAAQMEDLRGVPDLAFDADDALSGAAIVYDGANFDGVGGTSLASPLALAIWARLESQNNNKYGFAPLMLYPQFINGQTTAVSNPTHFTEDVAGFNDIQIGTNTTYVATTGYDYTTGLGSIDINRELGILSQQ